MTAAPGRAADTGRAGEQAEDQSTSVRQCGRCRSFFPVDREMPPMELAAWWACPDCRAALLPGLAPERPA